jgi:hypothetical protein
MDQAAAGLLNHIADRGVPSLLEVTVLCLNELSRMQPEIFRLQATQQSQNKGLDNPKDQLV